MNKWWQLGIEEVVKMLETSISSGLFSKEASSRLKKFGLNQLRAGKGRPAISIFLGQFKDFVVWVLIGAA